MSLRLRAVLIAGLSLAVLWLAAAAWMMRGVQANLDQALDGRLTMSARMVAGLLERSALGPGAVNTDFSGAVQISGSNGIACEIRALQGEVLARSTSGPPSAFDTLPDGFSTLETGGEAWRVYVLRADGYQITTADRVAQRHILTDEMLRAAGIPFLIAMLGGLAALWLGIGRGLAPLQALSRQLRLRQLDDTRPLSVKRPPQELRPVLDALNAVLARLAQALSSQRAFTDAAAHELRTPLTVIDTHLQVLRLTDGETAQASLASAESGVRRLRHTLEQMMVLARADAADSRQKPCGSILGVIAATREALPRQARQRLHVQAAADSATPLPAAMLATVLRNLIDNALKYSPDDSPIDLSLDVDTLKQQCCIRIADRGPGLQAEQYAQAGQRFWRAQPGRAGQEGAGLGISIVRAITAHFGGTLTLGPRPGGGLLAEVRLPLGRPPAAT